MYLVELIGRPYASNTSKFLAEVDIIAVGSWYRYLYCPEGVYVTTQAGDIMPVHHVHRTS